MGVIFFRIVYQKLHKTFVNYHIIQDIHSYIYLWLSFFAVFTWPKRVHSNRFFCIISFGRQNSILEFRYLFSNPQIWNHDSIQFHQIILLQSLPESHFICLEDLMRFVNTLQKNAFLTYFSIFVLFPCSPNIKKFSNQDHLLDELIPGKLIKIKRIYP